MRNYLCYSHRQEQENRYNFRYNKVKLREPLLAKEKRIVLHRFSQAILINQRSGGIHRN